jgi:hypothetical protein
MVRLPDGGHVAKRLSLAFDRRRSSPPWTELAASGAATIALFLTALASMTSLSSNGRSQPHDRTRTEVTFLSPPPTPAPPREKPVRPRATVHEPAPTPPQGAAPVVPTPPPSTSRVDTATVPALPPARLTDITVPNDRIDFRSNAPAARSGLGSPSAPAGLTDNSRAARGAATMTSHDSAFAAWAAAAHEVQRWSTMSPGAKTEVAQSTELITKLSQRVGTAGTSGDVHVMTGQGKDGVGAAGGPGTGSIGVPLFSRGRSRQQRMRDSVIDAEIRAGLARSAALIAARRDSVRADSLRADSLRKVAQARKP